MTTKLLIDRELLERIRDLLYIIAHRQDDYGVEADCIGSFLPAILAAPRQPEREGLGVVGWYHSHAEVATSDKARAVQWLPECVEPLCRLSDAQRAITELREECERLRHAPSQELAERLAAQLLESGAENYQEAQFDLEFEASGVKCVAVVRLQHPDRPSPHELRMQAEAERDTLRQQLADSDAALRESRANDTAAMAQLADMREQRDRLAGLLLELFEVVGDFAWDSDLEQRIDAALAEVKPCPESPAPTT